MESEGHNEKQVPKDPRSKANYVSRLLFWWLGPLIRYGFRHDLVQSDLYAHPGEADSVALHKKFNRYWTQELSKQFKGGTPRLWFVIMKAFWWRFLVQSLVMFTLLAVSIGQAVALGRLARYFSLPCDQRNDIKTRDAYLYGAGIVVFGILRALLKAHGLLAGEKIGMMTRIMMTSAIYGKVLTMNQVTIGRLTTGHIINLASNDVHRYDYAFLFVPHLWITPLQIAVSIYLVYIEISWTSLILLALICVANPVLILLARIYAKFRLKSAKLTDKRVRIMDEVIKGIKLIKMYTWEYAFKRVVQKLRRQEINLTGIGGVLRLMSESFYYGGALVYLFGITFLVYADSGNSPTAERVFTVLALVNLLAEHSITFFARCFFNLYEASVATRRIQNFLLMEHTLPIQKREDFVENDENDINWGRRGSAEAFLKPKSPYLNGVKELHCTYENTLSLNSEFSSITVSNLVATWTEENNAVLHGISFSLDHEAPLLCVIGPVGCGKSTLLQCLLGELEAVKGTVVTVGQLSYASQDNWVFAGTIRDNVTFGLPYDEDRYKIVVEACALDNDITSFPHGDVTLVGERGVTLSGGQKARVNLARAIYRNADIYLLDDPLSAVDVEVGKHIFDACLRGLLKDKLVVLVTHQVHFALEADRLLVLKDGEIQLYKTKEELSSEYTDVERHLGLIKTEEDDELVIAENDSNSNCSKVPHKQKNQLSEKPVATAEDKAQGNVTLKTYLTYFRAGGNYVVLFLTMLIFIFAEVCSVMGDWWITEWAQCFAVDVNLNESNYTSFSNNSCTNRDDASNSSYICLQSVETRKTVYSVLVIAALLAHFVRGTTFYLVCINASRVLHNRMFSNILHTPASFFDNNPSGRILNRFSKDVGFIDDMLPMTFFIFLALMVHFIAGLGIAVAASPYLLTVVPFIVVGFLLMRWYFLKSLRSIKRLEALARSPIYSHFSATLQGLPTIRTLQQQDVAFHHFHTFNNEHTKGWYLFLISNRWLSIRMDGLNVLLLISLVGFSIPIVAHSNLHFDSGLLGLALTYIVTLVGQFQWCVANSALVESQMVSTERIIAYSNLENEASLETELAENKPPKSWPSEGAISLNNVAFQYSPNLPYALKNVTFSVRPSSKLGIVGRTGAGKSSVISVLFRIAEPTGSIIIDGIDIKLIGLHDLRKNISIIPQDPILFSGTVRYNLDPFMEYSDSDLWDAIEQVQLKRVVKDMNGQLSGDVAEGGGNFSVGERQLLCLARALLRKNKILILDEATANVDPETDGIIQQVIRKEFGDTTVLTIAHRLNTIMDSDKILVMSNGQVKEFAAPYTLLQNADSQFYKMVQKTGPKTAKKLHQIALEAASKSY